MKPDLESTQSSTIDPTDGAPKDRYDSVMQMGESLPVANGYQFLTECNKTEDFRLLASWLLKNYQDIESYLDYWEQVKILSSEHGDKKMFFQTDNMFGRLARDFPYQKIVLEELDTNTDPDKPDRNIFEDIFEKRRTSKHPEIYEAILKGAINSVEGEKETVELVYNLLYTAIDSYDPNTIQYVLNTIFFDNSLPNNNEELNRTLLEAVYSKDEDILKKAIEIEISKCFISPQYFLEKEFNQYRAQSQNLREAVLTEITKKIMSSPNEIERFQNIDDFLFGYLEVPEEDGSLTHKIDDCTKYPADLILRNQGPLLMSSFWLLTGGNKDYFHLVLPGVGTFSTQKEEAGVDLEDIQIEILKYLKTEDRHIEELNKPGKASTIDNLTKPIESDYQKKLLRSVNAQIKENLQTNFKRPLSPRGNEIRITDKELKSLGYSHLIFRNGKNIKGLTHTDTEVTIFLGNYKMRFILDENYSLLEPTTRKPLSKSMPNVNEERELMMETWVLGHLEELLCTEDTEFTEKNYPTSEVKRDFERGYTSRVGHLRRLPKENWKPSAEQIFLAMEENGWDLIKINKNRITNGQNPVTYVRRTEVKEGTNKPPVKFYAHTATEKLNKIF